MPQAAILFRPDIALEAALVDSHPGLLNLTNAVYAEPSASDPGTVDVRVGRAKNAAVTLGTETTLAGAGHAVTLAAGDGVGGANPGGNLDLAAGAGAGGGANGLVRITRGNVRITDALTVGGVGVPAPGGGIFTGGLLVGFDGTPVADTILVGDDTFGLWFEGLGAGVMALSFAANDYLGYDRSTDVLSLFTASTMRLRMGETLIELYGSGATPARMWLRAASSGDIGGQLMLEGVTGGVAGADFFLDVLQDDLRLYRSDSEAGTSSVELGRQLSSGGRCNVALFDAGSFGGGAQVLYLANATTVPSSNPAGGCLLWAEGGDLKGRTSGGTVQTILPASGGAGVSLGLATATARAWNLP